MRYRPTWGGVFEQWARKWARDEGWRVAHVLGDMDDAIAECAYIWVKCLRRYGSTVDNGAWFMALFTTSVRNRWARLSEQNYRRAPVGDPNPADEPTADADAEILAQISAATPEVLRVLMALADAGEGTLVMIMRDKTVRSICQLAHCTPRDATEAAALMGLHGNFL